MGVLKEWFLENNLLLNVEKTQLIYFNRNSPGKIYHCRYFLLTAVNTISFLERCNDQRISTGEIFDYYENFSQVSLEYHMGLHF